LSEVSNSETIVQVVALVAVPPIDLTAVGVTAG